MINLCVSFLLILGSFSFFVAALAILRLPDVYMRASATAKAVTLGMGCLLLAMVLHFRDLETTIIASLVILFFGLTSPVAAQMVGRAAYLAGEPLWKKTLTDELADYYDPRVWRLGRSDKDSKNPDNGNA